MKWLYGTESHEETVRIIKENLAECQRMLELDDLSDENLIANGVLPESCATARQNILSHQAEKATHH